MADFIIQQSKPLFPKILWNRPVTSRGAGRMLIVGGQAHGFSGVQAAFAAALAAGIGECRLVLPDALRKVMPPSGGVNLVASTPTGSMARAALDEIIQLAEESDVVVVGIDLGKNSETMLLVERLMMELEDKLVVLAGDGLNILEFNTKLACRSDVMLVASNKELVRLHNFFDQPVNFQVKMLESKVNLAAKMAEVAGCMVVGYGPELTVSAAGQSGVTPSQGETTGLEVALAAVEAVFLVHNRGQRFEGLMTGAYIVAEVMRRAQEGLSVQSFIRELPRALEAAGD